mgnify:CR=1 FL=1
MTDKIQKVTKLRALLEEIQPDTILYHGVCGYELMDVAQYVKEHPNVLFYADSHEDFNNTARTRIAKLCYKYIHGYFLKKVHSLYKENLLSHKRDQGISGGHVSYPRSIAGVLSIGRNHCFLRGTGRAKTRINLEV